MSACADTLRGARSNIGVPAPAAPDPRLLAALLAGAASGQQRAAPEGPSLAEARALRQRSACAALHAQGRGPCDG
jgi:hypothetical protein